MNSDHITSLKPPTAFWVMAGLTVGLMVLLAVFCADNFYAQAAQCEDWILGF
jgi:hypothetical protein